MADYTRQVKQLLSENGCYFVRRGKGDHSKHKGAKAVKFNITHETLPAKEYLVIKGYCAFSDDAPPEYAEWVRMCGELNINGFDCYPDNDLNKRVERLMKISGSDEVFYLFCNSCRYDESVKTYIAGADIACENINNVQAGDGFEIVHLDAAENLVIDYPYGSDVTREEAFKEVDEYF